MAQTKAKGGCSHCEGSVPLAPDGLLMYHGDRNTLQGDCLGSRELPVTREGTTMTASIDNLKIKAQAAGIALTIDDIEWVDGEPEIDDMPADQWLDAMTMD